jgi:hypothetical protein
VSYPTAWLLHQKINRAMADREAGHLLDGAVQLDDANLGVERSGGKVAVALRTRCRSRLRYRWMRTVGRRT